MPPCGVARNDRHRTSRPSSDELNRQCADLSQEGVGFEGRRSQQLHVREAVEQRADGQLADHSAERGAGAEVRTAAERRAHRLAARDVEAIRVGEYVRIAERGAEQADDHLAARYLLSADLDVLE